MADSCASASTFLDHMLGRVPAAPVEHSFDVEVDDPSAAAFARIEAAARAAHPRASSAAPAASVIDMCDMGRTFSDMVYYFAQFGIMDARTATYERFVERVLLPCVRVSKAFLKRGRQPAAQAAPPPPPAVERPAPPLAPLGPQADP